LGFALVFSPFLVGVPVQHRAGSLAAVCSTVECNSHWFADAAGILMRSGRQCKVFRRGAADAKKNPAEQAGLECWNIDVLVKSQKGDLFTRLFSIWCLVFSKLTA
jgi:hypothetical protein